jgi:hypothetical protein
MEYAKGTSLRVIGQMMGNVSPSAIRSVKSRFFARKDESRLSRKPGQKPKAISTGEQLAATQWIQTDSLKRLRMTNAALGISGSRVRQLRRRAKYRFYRYIPIQTIFPHHCAAMTAFAMEMLAKADADRIIIFFYEAPVIEDPRKHDV